MRSHWCCKDKSFEKNRSCTKSCILNTCRSPKYFRIVIIAVNKTTIIILKSLWKFALFARVKNMALIVPLNFGAIYYNNQVEAN